MTFSEKRKREVEELSQAFSACVQTADKTRTVELALRAIKQHIIPDHSQLLQWCIHTLGHENTEHLVQALAQWSCPACEQGIETCETCEGSGWSLPGEVCDTCSGLRVTPCQFCGGAGLSTLDDIPSGLRLAVSGARAATAMQGLQRLSDKPKAPRQTLLFLNRLLGILETCLDDIGRLGALNHQSKTICAGLYADCVKTSAKIKQHMTLTLQDMIQQEKTRLKAQREKDRHSDPSQSHLKGYQQLLALAPKWKGTSLEHPILDRAIHRAKGSFREPANRQPERSKNPRPSPLIAA